MFKVRGFYFFFLLLAACASVCHSGQMSSHIYTAMKSKDLLSGEAAKCVSAHLEAYLAGSQGPDVVGVVMPALDKYSGWDSAGKETHYHPKKAELALNILDCARNDAERAYAIGWISHYINDIHIHQLVNRFGGFYEKDEDHHKALEQLETKYVMEAHSDVVTKARIEQDYAGLGATFPEFIFDAYQKTFPKNDLYKSDNKAYFCKRYNEAAGWCTEAHKVFYATHTAKSSSGDHGWGLATWKFPDMPSEKEYADFFKAVELKDVKAGKEDLTATLVVKDSKLFGRFLAEWEMAADDAVKYASSAYPLISQYLDASDPAAKSAVRPKLLNSIPKQNLDQPLDKFDHLKAFPGNKSWKTPYYSCLITPMDAPENAKEMSGRLPEMTVTGKGWQGTESGEVKVSIPIPPGLYPYEYDLKVALTGKDAFLNPAFMGRDWTQASGTTDTVGDARITVGEVFDVSMALTPSLSKLPGSRQWIIMNEDPFADAKFNLEGKLKGSSTSFAVCRHYVGQLPGSKEFVAELGRHRYDVTVLEEKVENGRLRAKLQVTDPSQKKLLGPQKLVCVFLDRPQAGSVEYAQAMKNYLDTVKQAKAVEAAIDKKVTSLSQAQKNKLIAQGKAYQAQLQKQGLDEAQQEKLMEKKYYELLASVGLKLTPQQKATLNKIQQANKVVESKSTEYNCAIGKFLLQPVDIKLDIPAGWQQEERAVDEERKSITRTLTKSVSKSGMSASCMFSVICTGDPKIEQQFAAETASNPGSKSAISIGDFNGVAYKMLRDEGNGSDYGGSEIVDCLLKKGKIYLLIRYNVNARGYKTVDGVEGAPAARSSFTALTKEANWLLSSVKLVAGKP